MKICTVAFGAFVACALSMAHAASLVLVPTNATWNYLADGSDQGTAWRASDFDDLAWPSGPAQLGYGDGDEATVLTTPSPRPVTVYFRGSVFVPDGVIGATLRLLRDDGAVVYINGAEVRRDNMPAGAITFNTLATVTVGGADESTFFESALPASAFVAGTNVIAVEVHQSAITSSDVSFALELIVSVNANSPGPVVTVTAIDSEAREIPPWLDIPENPAVFQITRTGSTNNALSVNVQLTGTASNGVDYELISSVVTIAAGSASANVVVHAIDDTLADGTETVVLNIVPTACPECYVIGSNSTATAYIIDNEEANTPPTVWISRPTDGATFTAPSDILLRAVASDREDGYEIAVEFFAGENRLGPATFIASLCPAVDCPSWDLTWSNVPPGIYTLTARAIDKNGAMTVSAPVHITVISTNPPPTNLTFIAMGSIWKYRDQCVDLGTEWRSVAYHDAAWAAGPAQLGYGDGDEATVISSGPDPAVKCITAYFRRYFEVSNPLNISRLTGRLLQDDGGVVYLNGVEVFRSNLPAGEISFNTVAVAASENQIVEFNIPPDLLLSSHNVIAVEMHQVNATSSDLSFDLELRGEVSSSNGAPHVVIVTPHEGDVFPAGTDIFLGANPAANGVQRVDFYTGNSFIGQAAGPLPSPLAAYGLTWNNPPVGAHTLTAVVTDSAGLKGTSAPVHITVAGGNNATNRPPVAIFLAPENGSAFTQGMNILLSASASDPDGSVARVEFRRGASLIGVATAAPGANYALMWSNPPVGSHTLTAVAVDNLNALGTSAPINITVLSHTPPETNFTFQLAFNNREGTEGVFFRQYTLNGPVNSGTLLPNTRVAPDDSGEWYYGAERQEIWRVNLVSGQVQFMEGQIPPDLPEFSWPIGTAFDSIRNRVLVGTLGGEGFLYAYSTASRQWSLVHSLNNHDLDCIVHHAANDSIYGVDVSGPRLVRFDANGNYVSEIQLPAQTFQIGRAAASSSELVSLGEYLVLLIEPNPAWYHDEPGLESRIYLIDPRTGDVRLTYSRPVLPDSDHDGVPDAEDQCPDTPWFALVDSHGCSAGQRDADHDGVPDNLDRCPNTPAGATVDEHGCSATQRDSDGDGVVDSRDECPGTPPNTRVDEHGCPTNSCPPRVQWQASFGGSGSDYFSSVRQLPDGGYVLGGSSYSGADGNKTTPNQGEADWWVLRIDASRNILWQISIGGPQNDDLFAAEPTSDGGFILGGYRNGGNFAATKLGPEGNVIWDREYQDGAISSIQQLPDGGFVLGGWSYAGGVPGDDPALGGGGGTNFRIVRIDPDGNVIWDRRFGGNAIDQIFAVRRTADGGFILVGASNSGVSGNKTSPRVGTFDGWVIRLDADGNKLWERAYGAPGGFGGLHAVEVMADGDFALAGDLNARFWFIRISSDGTPLWERTYANSDGHAYAMRRLSDGGFILAGDSGSDAGGDKTAAHFGDRDYWVLRINAAGNRIWDLSFGGERTERLDAMDLTADGGLILGGLSQSGINGNKTAPNFGSTDYWLVKLGSADDCDGDGVLNGSDECPNTPRGAVVNEHGCAIQQLCPCEGSWRDHEEYVGCVNDRAAEFYHAGLITREQRDRAVEEATKSRCGMPHPNIEVLPQHNADIQQHGYRLVLNAPAMSFCIVECSTNLIQWTPIQTNAMGGTRIEFADPAASNARARFYRLRCY